MEYIRTFGGYLDPRTPSSHSPRRSSWLTSSCPYSGPSSTRKTTTTKNIPWASQILGLFLTLLRTVLGQIQILTLTIYTIECSSTLKGSQDVPQRIYMRCPSELRVIAARYRWTASLPQYWTFSLMNHSEVWHLRAKHGFKRQRSQCHGTFARLLCLAREFVLQKPCGFSIWFGSGMRSSLVRIFVGSDGKEYKWSYQASGGRPWSVSMYQRRIRRMCWLNGPVYHSWKLSRSTLRPQTSERSGLRCQRKHVNSVWAFCTCRFGWVLSFSRFWYLS